ncbi:hypothetical protein ABD83_11135 [Bacillus xiamenensis]|uniref:Uncharacterized protein n=1 Tax=Bacillus xiamenensis TaxID=1178537 RepID=A0ABT4EXA9_9BACI|nr:Qat anti-phage system associated protein QatB [Bacillus xiamenensis]MBG9911984.1 hypothetical protein [Bacillus xiamenensis]MCY9574442.1 hypothetical protein [Bacillus xiamenensis]
MGTSSIYNGPKDRNSLLPEGFEDEYNNKEDDEEGQEKKDNNIENDEIPVGSWQEAKKVMSQYITGNTNNRGRVIRNYVRALGGSKTAAVSAVSGRGSTVRLGQFLSGIAANGISDTLESLKIEYKGKSVESLLSEIVNVIAGSSNTKEDIVAKNATIEALSYLYEYIEENGMTLESLDRINDDIFNEVMSAFVNNYIFERMLNDLQSRFEKYADSPQTALDKEMEFEDYIKESVELKLKEVNFNKLDYYNISIYTVIEETYRECYEVLEGYM